MHWEAPLEGKLDPEVPPVKEFGSGQGRRRRRPEFGLFYDFFCNFMDRISNFEDVQKMIWWLWLGLLYWKVIVGISYGEWKSFGIIF